MQLRNILAPLHGVIIPRQDLHTVVARIGDTHNMRLMPDTKPGDLERFLRQNGFLADAADDAVRFDLTK